ncbi:MAG TPA: hypothetical protein VLM89_17310 [Phycisphaerae bacterium]|nr:hypothetical protein [Phycisphaerae bacterium]
MEGEWVERTLSTRSGSPRVTVTGRGPPEVLRPASGGRTERELPRSTVTGAGDGVERDGGVSTVRGSVGRRVDMKTIGRLVSTEPSCGVDRLGEPLDLLGVGDRTRGLEEPGIGERLCVNGFDRCGEIVGELDRNGDVTIESREIEGLGRGVACGLRVTVSGLGRAMGLAEGLREKEGLCEMDGLRDTIVGELRERVMAGELNDGIEGLAMFDERGAETVGLDRDGADL